CALGSNAEVSAAAHLRRGITLLRITGFAPSVEARCLALPGLLSSYCGLRCMDEAEAAPLWLEAMTGQALAGPVRWQIHLPPCQAPVLVERLDSLGADWAMD